jgi:hypothetical protein
MGSSYIVRKGGGGKQAATPSINFVSKTDESITVTFTNNDTETATIAYRLDSLTAEGQSISVASNATSSNITFAGLNPDTEYTIFATGNVVEKTKSEPASTNITTDELIFTAATGGTTLEYDDGGKRFKSHTFTSNGDFVVTTVGNADRNQVDYLIIAGGGSGGRSDGNSGGGGGGAGGFRTTTGTQGGLGVLDLKYIVSTQSYSVVVGAGGAQQLSSNARGNAGSNSSFADIISIGGGGGGSLYNAGGNKNGGSGGGGGGYNSGTQNYFGGDGTANQGFDGGDAPSASNNGAAAGGGGAGQLGFNNSGTVAGNGGDGLYTVVRTGLAEIFAGGGGGGRNPGGANGGLGGGGNFDTAGTTNTGGGGGGRSSNGVSGAGGSGIVSIRYEIAPTE